MPFYPFSAKSLRNLGTAHSELRFLFDKIADFIDCSILSGRRTREEQVKLVEEGRSQTLQSKHLAGDDGYADAVDAATYPQDWSKLTPENDARMTQFEVDQVYFSGFVMGYAAARGIKLRWGGDWDGNNRNVGDWRRFRDLDHFERKLS
jgi:peptidoglycan LD-endopeptidase CwlK